MVFSSSLVMAAEEADNKQMASALAVDPMTSVGKVVLFLVLIVALIVFLAWLAGKSRALKFATGSEQLKTLAVMPLGIKEKVAVVQVGEKQLVLGITAQQINFLTELDKPLANNSADSQPLAFSELLKKAIRS